MSNRPNGDQDWPSNIDEFVAEKCQYYQPRFDPALVMQHVVSWQTIVWLPSLLAALVGGGLLQRAIGVGFANKAGEPISLPRAFGRAILPGIPAAIGIGLVGARSNAGVTTPPEWAFAFGLLMLVLLIVTAMRKRFLSDSLTGSYLVPR